MINEILQNFINAGEVASFIDNVIVETEKEEGYDEVVEKVVKILAKNNMYVKPEKYKWEVRKVEFLGVVIELEGIKIGKDKMKEVLDWLNSKEVKDM